ADAARAEMAELAGLRRGRIRLGATPTLCTSLVADVLVEFHDRHPGIDIEITESGSRTLIAALVEGALDLALIVTSVSSPAARAVLELEPILTERLVVVSAAGMEDPFGGGADVGVGLEQLARRPLIAFPQNYDLRAATDAAFSAAGLVPQVVIEGAEMDAALRFAERGIGVAVVPAMVAALHPGLRSAPLADSALSRTSRLPGQVSSPPRRGSAPEKLSRTVSIARRSDMAPAHATAALQGLIRGVADRLAADEPTLVARVG
ncbi:LysR family transcriptional regulator substrate-binding protein, partial [Microbacterium sp.]|uniref:LysR family transcriptional regulator substrate-binding protein n=1 Tax=Microbacterium sp. TaxID=51671 RepID=UPI003C78ACAF